MKHVKRNEIGYTDRSAVFDASHTKKLDPRGNILFSHTIVMNGQVVGTWKRTIKKDAVIVTPSLISPLDKAETRALAASVNRYGEFLEMPVSQRMIEYLYRDQATSPYGSDG